MAVAADIHATPLQKVLTIVGSLLVAVALATVSFTLLLTPWPTQAIAPGVVDHASSPATRDELVDVAMQTLAYCNGDPSAELPLGHDYRTSFTPDVVGHLDDVVGFFGAIKIAAVVSLVMLAACIALLVAPYRRPRGTGAAAAPSIPLQLLISRMLIGGCIALAVIVAVIAIAAVVDFYTLFNLLHSLFFSSGSWLFPYDSLLICALPQPYWQSMGVLWGLIIVVLMATLVITGVMMRRRALRRV